MRRRWHRVSLHCCNRSISVWGTGIQPLHFWAPPAAITHPAESGRAPLADVDWCVEQEVVQGECTGVVRGAACVRWEE